MGIAKTSISPVEPEVSEFDPEGGVQRRERPELK
jgi:hypothetical protein